MIDEDKTEWSNQEMLEYLLFSMIRNMYWVSQQSAEFMSQPRFSAVNLKDYLFGLQEVTLTGLFSYFDGGRGPGVWPGIMIVNAETLEPLTKEELSWAYAAALEKYNEQKGE